ncbi:MAG: hypothetical protein HIU57_00690 [Acidobacteria bacterium]|nr:hypothetical protein [Acidobacteriota bacterium]
MIALSVASVAVSSAVAMASPVARADVGAVLLVRGTVTSVTPTTGAPTSVTIQPRNAYAPSENILLGADTLYTQAGAPSTVAALVVGVPVRITLTGSPATAATVTILSPTPIFVGGTVTAFTPTTGTPTSVSIQPRDPGKSPMNVALGAGTLYYSGGRSTTVASLVVGAHVELEATGSPATATVVKIAPPRPMWIGGTVTALTPTTGTPTAVTVLPSADNAVAVSVALVPTTVYRQAGAVVPVSDLVIGSKVVLEASGNPETARLVRIAVAQPVYLNGMVTALTPATGIPTSVTVQPEGNFKAPVTVSLSASTVYYQLKSTTTIAALLVGSHVVITATGSPLTAKSVRIGAPLPDVTVGSVTIVTNTSMTVQPMASATAPVTFALTSATSYFNGRTVSTISEINVGDIVRVATAPSASTTALTVTVRDLAIIGRVVNVSDDVITVRGLYGATLVVNVNASTVFTMGKATSSRSALRRGELIVAVGPALSGVTRTVDAARVWIGGRNDDALHHALMQHREEGHRHHH